ncbi:MAG: thiamine-phosphate kinase [Chloroflexi bacterium RBG_13_53_26]|nr:MAG: thiamine-phosphate kinase [Chloroflexi bacterium RBG_13_53_26]
MKVSELGEFGLIELLSEVVPQGSREHRILAGIGDDAAAWRSDDSVVLATIDALVEGVHFAVGSPWWELGWKAVAVNLSDIAAMGGIPRYALVALSLPGDTEADSVVQLYRGMAELGNQFDVAVVGGNITSAPVTTITMTVIGQGQNEGILTRSKAVTGDLVAVTGYLGSAAAGLKMLTRGLRFAPETADFLRKAHLQPQPRVAQGQLLVKCGVRAAIDISDGLMADLGHLCKASRVGATIAVEQVPIHPLMRTAFPEDSLDFALTGGEDYELLFTADRQTVNGAKAQIEASAIGDDCPVTIVGEVTEGEGVSLLAKDGRPFHVARGGWDHFKKGG